MCIYVSVYIYIYIYIYTHTDTYVYTYINITYIHIQKYIGVTIGGGGWVRLSHFALSELGMTLERYSCHDF